MERFSYRYTLSKRALKLYEDCGEVKAWFDELAAVRSGRTACDYVDMLADFVEGCGLSPKELVKSTPNEAFSVLKNWAVAEIRKGSRSAGRLYTIWNAVKSFLKFHGIAIHGKPPFKKSVKYLDKIPTKEELRQILNAATSIPTRIAIELMCYGGLRPEDICDLKYSSIKNDFEKGVTPCAVFVPQAKSDSVYVTFIPETTVELIQQYFKLRESRGEKINDKSPIIANPRDKGKGIRRKTLTAKIESVIAKSGVQQQIAFGNKIQRIRPYSLRKYFRSNLTGHAPNEYIEAWLGHTSGLEHVYSGTRDLDPSTIERMREIYKRCEPLLLATAQPLDQNSLVKEAKIEALKSIAKTLLGIDLLEIKIAKEKEVGRQLNKDEELELYEKELKRLREGSHNPQKIIHEKELEKYLAEGWQFVSVLPS
ncbi:MAG: tyrosine-type recombinase/integrase, partial [Candidatus Bathyarchaeales archaeon]